MTSPLATLIPVCLSALHKEQAFHENTERDSERARKQSCGSVKAGEFFKAGSFVGNDVTTATALRRPYLPGPDRALCQVEADVAVIPAFHRRVNNRGGRCVFRLGPRQRHS